MNHRPNDHTDEPELARDLRAHPTLVRRTAHQRNTDFFRGK